jgi:hypothetical protein
VLPLAALVVALAGCARHGQARTAEVHGPDGGRFYATVYHFLAATDSYDRAGYVHDGAELQEEMEACASGAEMSQLRGASCACPGSSAASGNPAAAPDRRHFGCLYL